MAEIESIVEPDSVGDDVRWESMAFIRIHRQIISLRRVNLAIPEADIEMPLREACVFDDLV